MDHSWGPRPELGQRSVSWISLNFGDDLAFHLAVPMSLKNGEVSYDKLRFGFVVDKGEVHGLTEAQVSASRVQMMPISSHIRMKDVRGKAWEFHGTTLGGHPWYSFNPCHTCFQVLMRYQNRDLVGYGEFGDIFGLDYLGERISRSAREGR
jgi:hypothetical protein